MAKPAKLSRVKLKVNDEVMILAGREKGKRGKIMAINRLRSRVIVQGVNRIKRFQRPTQENPQGGVLEIERPLHLSNVGYYDSKTKMAKRLGYQIKDGKKMRMIRAKKFLYEIKDKDKGKEPSKS